MTDFEGALMNQCGVQFHEGQLIECLFHPKQASQKHIIQELQHFSPQEITYTMEVGVLDVLSIISQKRLSLFL